MTKSWAKKVVILIPLVVILWVVIANIFPRGYIYTSGDFAQPINIEDMYKYLPFVWGNRLASPGEGSFFSWFAAIPYYFVFYLIPSYIGLEDSQILSFILFLFLLISYISFNFSLRIIFGKKKGLLTILYPLLYSLNLTTLYFFTYTWGFSHQAFLYTVLPLVIATFYSYQKDSNLKNLALFLLSLFLSVSGFANSAFFLALCLFLLLFLFFLFVTKEVPFSKRKIISNIVLGVFSLAVLNYWFLPTSVFVKEGMSSLVGGVFDLENWLEAQSADLFSIFMGLQDYRNYFPFRYGFKGLLLLSFAPIFLLFYMLFRADSNNKDSNRKVSIALLMVGLIYIVLLKKAAPPFGNLTLKLFRISFLPALRSYEKVAMFIPFIIFTSLYGLLPEKWFKKGFYSLFVGIFLLIPLPFLIGGIQQKYSITFGEDFDYFSAEYSSLVSIPKDYYEASDYLNENLSDTKIQALPYSAINTVAWVNYPKWKLIGLNPTENLFDKSTISQNTSLYLLNRWNPSRDLNSLRLSPFWYIKMLRYFNVSHIIYHKDVSPPFIFQSLHKIKELEDLEYLSKIFESENIVLYELSENYKYPHFYVSELTFSLSGGLRTLPYVLSTNENFSKSHFVLNNVDGSNPFCLLEKNSLSKIYGSSRWGENWEWPSFAAYPNTVKYRAAQFKGSIKYRLAEGYEERINIKLLSLAKRALELTKFDLYEDPSAIARFTRELEDIKEELEAISDGGRESSRYRSAIEKVLSYLLRIKIEYGDTSSSKEFYDKTTSFFYDWVYSLGNSDCADFCYYVDVPKDGVYEVLVTKSDSTSDYLDNNLSPELLLLEHNKTPVKLIKDEENKYLDFISFGYHTFSTSSAKQITLKLSEPQDLISKESWSDYQSFSDEDGNIFMGSQMANPPIMKLKEINDWEPNQEYSLSFEYKVRGGSVGYAVVEDLISEKELFSLDLDSYYSYPTTKSILIKEEKKETEYSDLLLEGNYPGDDGWGSFERTFRSSNNSYAGYIFLYSTSVDDSFANIQLRNVNIHKIVRPEVILRGISDSVSQNAGGGTRLEFIKINPTKYRVRVIGATGPYNLVFSEAFNKGWRVYNDGRKLLGDSSGDIEASYLQGDVVERKFEGSLSKTGLLDVFFKKSVPEDQHYLSNGYSNTWLINPGDVSDQVTYEVVVEFIPQKLFYMGSITSLLTVATCLFVIVKKRK